MDSHMLAEISALNTDGQGPEPDANGSRHVMIVGGGASGVLLACHLLRRFSDNIKVTLIERNPTIGHGLAYGTANPAHLLNVRAANMSAFADDPDHFWQWLLASRLTAVDSDQFCFVSRQLFGRYIESLLQGLTYGENRELNIVQAECIAIAPTPSGASARLADAENELGRTVSRIASAEAQLGSAEEQVKAIEARAIRAEQAFKQLEQAIRKQLLGLESRLNTRSASAA